jgi:HD-GYP domain-containing protein (c-di-GMP phosphodiesterase class II)
MAGALELSPLEAELAALAGLAHDVGIREVAGSPVARHRKLDAQERRRFQSHAPAGAELVAELGLERVGRVIRHHHERWDGQGYPDRLAGTAIPFLSRLVQVAEVYDVLTAPYSYRRTVSPERAIEMLRASAGAQLDPEMVEVLAGVVS